MKIGAWEASLDLYAVLGVTPSATRQRIRAAYRRLIFDTHPDARRPSERASAEASAKRLNLAATILLDAGARARYDALRAARRGGQPGTRRSTPPAARSQVRESEFWPFTQPRPATAATSTAQDIVPVVPPPRVNGVVATVLLAAGFVLGFAMLSWLAAPIEPPSSSAVASNAVASPA
jgi:curved DNA-binding protein CbpA